MSQISFADTEYAGKRKKTRREVFLEEMELVVPWKVLLKRGSIVDATIIAAPSSTKNAEGERDPEMHQTEKGNQWFFGMKAHIGVDADSGLVHTVTTTAANEADVEQACV